MGQSPGQGYLAGLVSWMRPIVQPGGSSILRHGGMSPHGSSGVFSTPAAAQETDPGPSSPVDSFRLNPYSGAMCGGVRDSRGVGCQAVPLVYSEQPAVFAVAVGESAAGAAAGRKRRNRDTQAVVQCSAPQSGVGYWQRQVRRLLMQGSPVSGSAGQVQATGVASQVAATAAVAENTVGTRSSPGTPVAVTMPVSTPRVMETVQTQQVAGAVGTEQVADAVGTATVSVGAGAATLSGSVEPGPVGESVPGSGSVSDTVTGPAGECVSRRSESPVFAAGSQGSAGVCSQQGPDSNAMTHLGHRQMAAKKPAKPRNEEGGLQWPRGMASKKAAKPRWEGPGDLRRRRPAEGLAEVADLLENAAGSLRRLGAEGGGSPETVNAVCSMTIWGLKKVLEDNERRMAEGTEMSEDEDITPDLLMKAAMAAVGGDSDSQPSGQQPGQHTDQTAALDSSAVAGSSGMVPLGAEVPGSDIGSLAVNTGSTLGIINVQTGAQEQPMTVVLDVKSDVNVAVESVGLQTGAAAVEDHGSVKSEVISETLSSAASQQPGDGDGLVFLARHDSGEGEGCTMGPPRGPPLGLLGPPFSMELGPCGRVPPCTGAVQQRQQWCSHGEIAIWHDGIIPPECKVELSSGHLDYLECCSENALQGKSPTSTFPLPVSTSQGDQVQEAVAMVGLTPSMPPLLPGFPLDNQHARPASVERNGKNMSDVETGNVMRNMKS